MSFKIRIPTLDGVTGQINAVEVGEDAPFGLELVSEDGLKVLFTVNVYDRPDQVELEVAASGTLAHQGQEWTNYLTIRPVSSNLVFIGRIPLKMLGG